MTPNEVLAEKIVADLGLMNPYEFETMVQSYRDQARQYLRTPEDIVADRYSDGKMMTGYQAAYSIIAFLVALRHLYYGPAAQVDDLESLLQ